MNIEIELPDCAWYGCTEYAEWRCDFVEPFSVLGRVDLCEEHKDAYDTNGAIEIVGYIPHELEDLLWDAGDEAYTRQKEADQWGR